MRPLLFIIASLFSFCTAQGVVQREVTTLDLARLLGDITSLEITVPEGAKSVGIAFTLGDEGGHTESSGPLLRGDELIGDATLHLLIRTPGLGNTFDECGGELIDVIVTYPDASSSTNPLCTPLLEGDARHFSRRKHEYVFTGPIPVLEEWTPVYLRAWTPIELGVSDSGRRVDLATAFTIQVRFSAAEFEQLSTEMPLDSAGLLQVPEVRRLVDPFGN